MFSKSKQNSGEPTNPQPAPRDPAPKVQSPPPSPVPKPAASGSSGPSIISAALTVTGNLDCSGDIEIKGSVDGDLKARNVRIDESGKIKGKIVADSAYIDGGVRGQIVAKVVALAGSANVRGDILHETLSIEAGAFLDGNCRRLKESDRVEEQPRKEQAEPAKPVAAAAAAHVR